MTSRAGRRGHTLIEVLVVVLVLAALAAIALPQYASQTEDARGAQCTAIRDAAETAERTCFLDHGAPCLVHATLVAGGYLPALPACPSGGTYVWLANDPSDSAYPRLGCSKHDAPVPAPPAPES